MPTAPTVVLVHGAFADAASFAAVVPTLLDDGLSVVVPALPNRSLAGDAAYVASVVRQIEGPVLLVGHSYGGAVITVAEPGPAPTVRSTPWASSMRMPSRTAGRLAPSSVASSRSGGRWSPTFRAPVRICSSTASTTS